MMETEICSFCNSVIAPGDPARVEHQGRVAHQSCIVRNRQQLEELCLTVHVFLAGCWLHSVSFDWRKRQQDGHIRSYRTLVDSLRETLVQIAAWRRDEVHGDGNAWPDVDMVDEFRERMGYRLMVDLGPEETEASS